MPPDFQEPAISITNVYLRNTTGLTPEFEVSLRIINPNRVPLEITGMSYEILLEGNKVVTGVSNDFPTIEPYSEIEVDLEAQLSLTGSLNLVRDLLRSNNDSLDYEFSARLDLGGNYPIITIGQSGEIGR